MVSIMASRKYIYLKRKFIPGYQWPSTRYIVIDFDYIYNLDSLNPLNSAQFSLYFKS
jgi:hypothetical protein